MIPNIDPTNAKGVVTAAWNGIYEQVNLNLNGANQEVAIKQLNGRQGDNHRPVNIQLVKSDGNNANNVIPYNYGSLYPQIVGKDAEDNTLEFGDDWHAQDPQSGFLNISVPTQAYAAVGLSKNMYLRMIDENGTVVSSVPIVYETEQDSAMLSNHESQTYMQKVDQIIEMVRNQIGPLLTALATTKQSADITDADVKDLVKQIADNAVGVLSRDQTWTGHNQFTGLLTAKILDAAGTIHINGFDMQQLIDFYRTFSDTGWTHDQAAWLNGVTPFSGTNGFWMRRVTFMGVHLLFVSLACWIPSESAGDVAVVAMPQDYVGDVANNNYFSVPIWSVANGQSTAFGAHINTSYQLIITSGGGKNVGVNGTMLYVN